MDFKNKLLSLLTDKKDSQTVQFDDDFTNEEWINDTGIIKLKQHCTQAVQDPRIDKEAIESIDKSFFTDQSLDAAQFQLMKFSEPPELHSIESTCAVLKTQLQAVSRKISELVLENHPSYVTELERVMELQRSLEGAVRICSEGRGSLSSAKKNFTTTSLNLLANYKRRQQLMLLAKSLHTIKTLQRTDIRLKELLKEEDYPGAIQLSLEYQKAANTYKHYKCISELSNKLHDKLDMIDEALDVALSRTCHSFDVDYYSRIQQAYRLLGKTQVAVDQLLMHYTSIVHNTAFTKVLGYVELCSGTGDGNFQKKQFPDLCKFIKSEVFMPCLYDLCKALWEVVLSYKKTIDWHALHDNEEDVLLSKNSSASTASTNNKNNNSTAVLQATTTTSSSLATGFGETRGSGKNSTVVQQLDLTSIQYIRNKLEVGRARIWGEIQQKVKVFLLSTDLSHFKYEEFIRVLDVVNRLMKVGEEFCQSKSEGLVESIRKQSINYFRNYHQSRLDELKTFMENEAWEICPVKSGFNVFMLQEFKFMKSQNNNMQIAQQQQQLACNNNDDAGGGSATASRDFRDELKIFEKYSTQGTPFDIQPDEEDKEDVMEDVSLMADRRNNDEDDGGNSSDSDDDDVPDELKRDFVDEETGEATSATATAHNNNNNSRRSSLTRSKHRHMKLNVNSLIVTNTTLNVCRVFGNYMQMLSVLKSISYDVVYCMTQLIDYYLFTVYNFFTSDVDKFSENELLGPKFRSTLRRIREDLLHFSEAGGPSNAQDFKNSTNNHNNSASPDPGRLTRVGTACLSSVVKIDNPKDMFGLRSRIVATESLLFLAEQFKLLQPSLDEIMPPAKKNFLQQYLVQTLNVAGEVRRPVYRIVVARSIDTDNCLQMMSVVKWDVKDIMSQHSQYVDVLLNEISSFHGKLMDLSKSFPLPTQVSNCLWEHVSKTCNQTLVEGFSSAKKCTNEGRGLMMLDFQQFLIKLEKFTALRPIPGREYVEAYIKAFYLPENQLESWVSERKDYSSKQLVSLVSCLGHISKKTRQKLLTTIEEGGDRLKR